MLKDRDIAATHPFTASASAADAAATSPSQQTTAARASRNGSSGRLEKRQIEQRIEEDRERHKRLRESIWAVPGEGDEELEKVWDEASEVAEDDYVEAFEGMDERRRVVEGC